MEIPPERYPRREHSAKVNEYSWGCRRRREAKHANARSINIYAVRFVRCCCAVRLCFGRVAVNVYRNFDGKMLPMEDAVALFIFPLAQLFEKR